MTLDDGQPEKNPDRFRQAPWFFRGVKDRRRQMEGLENAPDLSESVQRLTDQPPRPKTLETFGKPLSDMHRPPETADRNLTPPKRTNPPPGVQGVSISGHRAGKVLPFTGRKSTDSKGDSEMDAWGQHGAAVSQAVGQIDELAAHVRMAIEAADMAVGLIQASIGSTNTESAQQALAQIATVRENLIADSSACYAAKENMNAYGNLI